VDIIPYGIFITLFMIHVAKCLYAFEAKSRNGPHGPFRRPSNPIAYQIVIMPDIVTSNAHVKEEDVDWVKEGF
jgi:hypothetical protein